VTAIVVTNAGFYVSGPPTIRIANPPHSAVPLVNETNSNLSLSPTPGLGLTNYFFTVSNSYGSVTSALVTVAVALPPQRLSAAAVGSGIQLSLTGSPGTSYILEFSTNLIAPTTWQPLCTSQAAPDGAWSFVDTNLGYPQMFYRTRTK
jgi:hypothetical protein